MLAFSCLSLLFEVVLFFFLLFGLQVLFSHQIVQMNFLIPDLPGVHTVRRATLAWRLTWKPGSVMALAAKVILFGFLRFMFFCASSLSACLLLFKVANAGDFFFYYFPCSQTQMNGLEFFFLLHFKT